MDKKVEIKIFDEDVVVPSYAKSDDAGMDLRVSIKEPYTLYPGETKLFSTELAIHIDDKNIVGIIVPRSGLGSKHGIIISNGTGVIDSGYTGKIGLSLFNRSDVPFTVNNGDRVAQLIFMPIIRVQFEKVKEFSVESDRGASGFGSSGIK